MIDARPPRTSGDERRTLMAHLQFQRDSLIRKVDGLDDDRARWSPVGSGTSLHRCERTAQHGVAYAARRAIAITIG